MDRRELLKMIAALTGGVVIGGEAFLSGCTNKDQKAASILLTEKDVPFLNEVAETILPATKTPGAKAANVGQFMTVVINDCYDEEDQKIFREGMDKINDACKKMHGHSFMDAKPEERHQLLLSIDKETKDFQDKFNKDQEIKEKAARDRGDKSYKREQMPKQYYSMVKQLTLWGYFTSKEGITQALRFTPVPGKYVGCIDYKKGEAAFAGLDG